MQQRSFGNTLKNLALALLNATLILVAICLFFAWQTAAAINNATHEISENLVTLEPLREDIGTLTADITALRTELENLQDRGEDASSEAVEAIQARIDTLDTRITAALDQVQTILAEPEALIDYAIDQTSEQVKLGVQGLLQCTRPEA